MKQYLLIPLLIALLFAVFVPFTKADTSTATAPAVINQLGADAGSVVVQPASFVQDVIAAVRSFSSFSTWFKLAAVFLFAEIILKLSFLASFWAKFGSLEAWAPNVLALLAGAMTMAGIGGSLSLGSVTGYLSGPIAGALIVGLLTLVTKNMSPTSTLGIILKGIEGLLAPVPPSA